MPRVTNIRDSVRQPGIIASIIRGSLANPVPTLLVALLLLGAGLWALLTTPIDALPDLSDEQVIIRTSFPGRAPRVVEDQVTFPLTTALRSVPGAVAVRGYSLFGDSFVYVVFRDGTDPYWARSRVLEYLAQGSARLPPDARPMLGPDATGVGWIYEYALVDRTGKHDLARMRAVQDWLLKYELQSVEGVAEVATVGGMVKQYQIVLDPDLLRAQRVTLGELRSAIERGNRESGGSVVELAEAEYMVRSSGYVRGVEDLREIPIKLGSAGASVSLGDVADVRIGPETRRGIADLDGEGEVVGGIVVLRRGADAHTTIRAVEERLREIVPSLPAGIEVVTTYDRSSLIERAISSLTWKLLVEMLVVLAVCIVFLRHVRSGLVIAVCLPLGLLVSFLIMRMQGLSANIMSLGGIAIAIGTMVDAAVVMVENAHKQLERAGAGAASRLDIIAKACSDVGPALFFSLLIVALSFVPVLALEGQEGRLFAPLAYTKTYAMLAAALISITVVPVLLALSIGDSTPAENANPLNRATARAYQPALAFALRHPWGVVLGALAIVIVSVWPFARIGGEFMPELDEGDLLYMPTTLPAISADATRSLLQTTDRLIRDVPEVQRVFGKAGRADSATDPAPLEMFETVVQLKDRDSWRPGVTLSDIRKELDARVALPGLVNAWIAPIRARIDMLSTGIRTPLGIKVKGPDSEQVEQVAARVERIVREVPGAAAVYAERTSGGRYIDIDVDRAAASRNGLNIEDVHEVVDLAIGGETIGYTTEGRERYPINMRFPQSWRDSAERIADLPVLTRKGPQVTLGDIASVNITAGPTVIRTENARPSAWITVQIRDRDPVSFMQDARDRLDAAKVLPAGFSLQWSGQYEYMQRAFGRLVFIVPLVLGITLLLSYLALRSLRDVLIIVVTVPVALVGAGWTLWLLGYHMSVAVAVGLIALAGVAAETGIVMLLYLNNAWAERRATQTKPTQRDLNESISEGALLRLRPKLMTVTTIIAGLLPIMIAGGTGSEVMRRIAAPMVGGMLSATLLTLLVIPALFLLIHRRHVHD